MVGFLEWERVFWHPYTGRTWWYFSGVNVFWASCRGLELVVFLEWERVFGTLARAVNGGISRVGVCFGTFARVHCRA